MGLLSAKKRTYNFYEMEKKISLITKSKFHPTNPTYGSHVHTPRTTTKHVHSVANMRMLALVHLQLHILTGRNFTFHCRTRSGVRVPKMYGTNSMRNRRYFSLCELVTHKHNCTYYSYIPTRIFR